MLSKAMTFSFLTLVLKSPNLVSLDNYRPIYSLGCMYKAIAKILLGRLKKVLNSIVSPNQSAFV